MLWIEMRDTTEVVVFVLMLSVHSGLGDACSLHLEMSFSWATVRRCENTRVKELTLGY